MEILKEDPIIDNSYKPSMSMQYMDYFNRALVFAQTNYAESLSRLASAQFGKMTSTFFFEQYAWTVCTVRTDPKIVAEYFGSVSKCLQPYYRSFWEFSIPFPREDAMENSLIHFIKENECQALWKTAHIIYSGSKLFGWDTYRNNYLNSSNNLQILPLINSDNSFQLCCNIGLEKYRISGVHLAHMANHWGFTDPDSLCEAIRKHIVLQPKIIAQILWYAFVTFGSNISEP